MQDVDRLTDTLKDLILQLVVFPGIVIYYTYKCWYVTAPPQSYLVINTCSDVLLLRKVMTRLLHRSTMGYLGPVCIYGYFLVSCVINKFLMSPIVKEVSEVLVRC